MKGHVKETIVVEGKVKTPAPLWCRLCRTAVFFLLLFRVVLLIFNLLGYMVLFRTVGQSVIFFFYDAVLLILCIFSFHFRRKPGYWIACVLLLPILLLYGTNVFSYAGDTSYLSFLSPQGTNTLVVRETGSIFSGECRFYRKVNGGLVKDTGARIRIDDGYQSFRDNPRQIVWLDENTVRVSGHTEGQEPGGTQVLIQLK